MKHEDMSNIERIARRLKGDAYFEKLMLDDSCHNVDCTCGRPKSEYLKRHMQQP